MSSSKQPDNDISKYFSLEAEAAVLGSMLLSPECISKVLPMLPRSDAFFLPEHQIIYEALVALYIADKPIDAVSLRTELKQRGQLEKIKGTEIDSVKYLGKLMETTPDATNAFYYSRIIREKEKEREVYSAVEQINTVLNESNPIEDKIQSLHEIVLSLEAVKATPDFIEAGKIAFEVLESMENPQENVIKTGFKDLDRKIYGFLPSEFIIVGGRPGMGKTAFVVDLSLNMTKAGTSVLIVSLEMTEKALVGRSICNLASIDITKIQAGAANDSDWQELRNAATKLQGRNLIISSIGYTPEQLGGLIHRLKQTHNIGICFVDYLQLMTTGGKVESRQQEITAISRKLKAIAKRENIPLVVLSQLNRQVDIRDDHRPRTSDLRESGSLEQDADMILLLYRPDHYKENEPEYNPTGIAEVIIAKTKRGPVGRTKLVFVPDYVRFNNLPEQSFIGDE